MMTIERPIRAAALGFVATLTIACGDATTSPLITSRYTVTELANGAQITIAGLNNAGQLIGRAPVGTGLQNILIANGTTTDLGSCEPRGINAEGTVACAGGGLWRDGQVTAPNFPGDFSGSPVGINDQGTTAGLGGNSAVQGQAQDCPPVSCVYVATATRVALFTIPTGTGSFQFPRIDNGTDVVVFSGTGQAGPSGTILGADSSSRPYPCAGLPASGSLKALGGNGEVVGSAAQVDAPSTSDAIVCRDGVMETLSSVTSQANDISESGLIVGTTDDGHGFLWDNGRLTVLDQGIASGWHVTSADWVNDAGQIVVVASNGLLSETLLLTPR